MKLALLLSSLFIATHVAIASVSIKPVVRSGESGGYSYDRNADNGPSHWGSLEHDFATCSAGHHQSPINIVPRSVHNGGWENAPVVKPHTAFFSFSNGTSNWALNCETQHRCGHTTYNGKRFHVVNLHFHSPSEHTVNGEHYPLEAHMVHSSSDASLLVISTLFTDKPKAERRHQNGLLRPPSSFSVAKRSFHSIVDHIHNERHTFSVHMPSFIGHRGYCTYQGSLTTPPCSEEVTWLVAIQEHAVHSDDIQAYTKLAASAEFGNNRPVHRLNDREVTCFRPPRSKWFNHGGLFYNLISRFHL